MRLSARLFEVAPRLRWQVAGQVALLLCITAAYVGQGILVARVLAGATAADLRGGLILLGALILPLAVTPPLESQLAHVVCFRVLIDVRSQVYEAFERLAPGYLIERRSGDLGATAISDVEELELFIAHTLA